ncbi:MAG: hypothetical protein H8E11_01565 [Candidatus Cloacimonetes bacterium]|nr:hypothetical protein [Candidatus Cloacimonadota bacterium]
MKLIPKFIIYFIVFCSTLSFVLCGFLYSSNIIVFYWTMYVGIILGVIAGFLKWQNEIWKNIKNNIAPNISCLMEYPIKVEGKHTYRDTSNPNIIINNSGPITVISLSAKIATYIYNTKEKKIDLFSKTSFKRFEHAVSATKLEPFNKIEQSTIGINGNHVIAVYIIKIIYYRESDMKSFTLNDYFFTHNKKIYNDSEFKINKNYKKIVETVKSYNPTITKSNEIKLTATAEHSWFIESNPSLLHRINDDGSVTFVGLPIIQSRSCTEGFPHLIVTPSRFEEINYFIKAEISGENINIQVKYEINNIGDISALITEDIFTSIIEIAPGEKRNYFYTFEITRGPNNNSPLQEFIDMLEMEKETPIIKLILLYRPKNNNDKLFKVISTYEFSKNKFKLIKN